MQTGTSNLTSSVATTAGAARALTASKAPLTEQAQKWVSQTFYGTLLKQMRNSPFRSELVDGGRGGEVFGSLFDQQLADRMSGGVGGGLVRAIVRKLEAAGEYRRLSKPTQNTEDDSAPDTRHPALPTPRRAHVAAARRA